MKISMMQLLPCGNDQVANLEKADIFCRKAKLSGADLAVFPEMWNIGYKPFFDKELLRQFHTQELPEDLIFKNLMSQAIEQESSFIKHFQSLAKELDMAITMTYLEKNQGKLRNTATLIDRHGNSVMTYAKIHTVDHWLEKLCTSGDDFHVCELDTAAGPVKIGMMICFDINFPESARILMLKGAEIILTPNAGHQDANRIEQLKSRGFENMLGVVMACYPAPLCNGHSCAVDGMVRNVDGTDRNPLLIEAGYQEGLFLAEFDLPALRAYRAREVWGNKERKPQYYQLLTKLSS